MKAENLKFTNSEMLDHLYVYVSLVPRPSHIFNVARRMCGWTVYIYQKKLETDSVEVIISLLGVANFYTTVINKQTNKYSIHVDTCGEDGEMTV